MTIPSWFAPPLLVVLLVPAAANAGRPTLPELTDRQEERVREGKVVLTTTHDGEDSTWSTILGIAEIDAAEDTIWSILTSTEHTVASSAAMQGCTVEDDQAVGPGHRRNKIRYDIRAGFEQIVCHVVRDYYPDDHWLAWVIDEGEDNDVAWTEGTYSTHPGLTDGRQLLLYSSRVDTGKPIPRWLEEALTQSSLKRYLSYVQATATAG